MQNTRKVALQSPDKRRLTAAVGSAATEDFRALRALVGARAVPAGTRVILGLKPPLSIARPPWIPHLFGAAVGRGHCSLRLYMLGLLAINGGDGLLRATGARQRCLRVGQAWLTLELEARYGG